MFNDIVQYPIQSERLRWSAKEVVKDISLRPHLFVRITLSGTLFPQMGQRPVVKVGNLHAHHVLVSDDRLTVKAYFDREPSASAPIEFGFGDVMLLRFRNPFAPNLLARLDRKRLPKDIALFRE